MPRTKESGTVDPFADMPSGKTFIEEAREFALTLEPDIGPLFGRDVVRLLDALEAERDALREALERIALGRRPENGEPWTSGKSWRIELARLTLERLP